MPPAASGPLGQGVGARAEAVALFTVGPALEAGAGPVAKSVKSASVLVPALSLMTTLMRVSDGALSSLIRVQVWFCSATTVTFPTESQSPPKPVKV